MKTIRDILSSGTAYLEARGIEGARSSMQALIAHVMNTDRTWIYLHTDETLPEDKLAELRTLLRSRGQGVPLQHLLGSVEFYRRSFRSDSRPHPTPRDRRARRTCPPLFRSRRSAIPTHSGHGVRLRRYRHYPRP